MPQDHYASYVVQRSLNVYKELSALQRSLGAAAGLKSARKAFRAPIEFESSVTKSVLPSRKVIATMAKCVTCHKPLILDIELDEDDEDETMGGSASANTGSYVDDDVQLQCGCHFHWSVHLVLLI